MARAAAKIKLRLDRARKDPGAFVEFAWRTPDGDPLELAWFHREWMEIMTNRRRVMIEAPKGLGKSTIICAMAAREIGLNRNIRIKIACATDAKAKERLFEIRENLMKNPALKLLFPDLRLHESGEKSRMRFFVERPGNFKDATVEAAGILSSVGGGRADIVIADDIVDVRNCLIYPALRETVKSKYLAEWIGMLEPNGRVWYICNPMHRADLTSYLKAVPGYILHRTFNGEDGDPYKPLWPERHDREFLKLKAAELGKTEYDRAYRCVTLASDTVTVKPEWIKYYDSDMIGDPEELVCVTAYDLAIAQGKKNDFFAGVTLFYNPKRNTVFVADAYQDKASFTEQGRYVTDDYRRWRPDRIGIETVGYQSALSQYIQEKNAVPLPIVLQHPGKGKASRLSEFTPLFEEGRIFFHPNLDSVQNHDVFARGDLINQLLEFPQAPHDDLVDAFTYALALLREFQMGAEDDEFVDGDGLRMRVSVLGA
jgi:predicted phage terminase large subunit-like protein